MSLIPDFVRRRPSFAQVALLALLIVTIFAFVLVRDRQASAAHPINALAFSPDGKSLACSISREVPPGLELRLNSMISGRKANGTSFHEVRIWDLRTRRITATLGKFPSPVGALAFSPDGKTLVTGGYKEWKAWDASTWRCRAASTGLTQWVNSVAYSPDGSTLATTGQDMAVRLWDTDGYRERAVIDGAPSTMFSVSISRRREREGLGHGDETVATPTLPWTLRRPGRQLLARRLDAGVREHRKLGHALGRRHRFDEGDTPGA
jgi:hypothetical protein